MFSFQLISTDQSDPITRGTVYSSEWHHVPCGKKTKQWLLEQLRAVALSQGTGLRVETKFNGELQISGPRDALAALSASVDYAAVFERALGHITVG